MFIETNLWSALQRQYLNFLPVETITLEHKWQLQVFPNFEMAKNGFYPLQIDTIPLNFDSKWSRSQDMSI
jgi:hypothetical protein